MIMVRRAMDVIRKVHFFGLVLLAALPVDGGQEPSLEAVLDRATRYVDNFYVQLSGIVAEESYEQRSRATGGIGSRSYRNQYVKLRSDYLLMRPEGSDRYYGFRDVFEVDGRPVRDRQNRLTQLFLNPSASVERQIEGILNDSARYNVGDVVRNINTPTLALLFLREAYRPGFEFEHVSDESPPLGFDYPNNAPNIWVVKYRETSSTTVFAGGNDRDLPAHGRFWIEPTTGRVLVTELALEDPEINTLVAVTFQMNETIGHFVPVEMRELYGNRRRGSRVDGTATYSRFRRFEVSTASGTDPKTPNSRN